VPVYLVFVRHLLFFALFLVIPAGSAAQTAAPADSITALGVFRASAVVDSVFVDRLAGSGFVSVGDWASYLMARLGVVPIPPDLKIRVVSDSQRIRLSTLVGDLPYEAKRAMGPLVGMLPPDTEIAGEITLTRSSPEVVRFHLETVRVNGIPLPEPVIYSAMLDVGKLYPSLTRTGRDLYVQVPPDAEITLGPSIVSLTIRAVPH
jgi:hypothetical protein